MFCVGNEVPNKTNPDIYNNGLVTVAENSVVPCNMRVGKNVCIIGKTTLDDYSNSYLASGETLIKVGE